MVNTDGMDSSQFSRHYRPEALSSQRNNQEDHVMDATTVAIDLAKDVFQVAVANRAGRVVDRQRFTRRQFERFLDTLDAEPTWSWSRAAPRTTGDAGCRPRGLRVQLLPVQYVRPYVRRNKTDRADTDALLEARSLRRDSSGAGKDRRTADAPSDPSRANAMADCACRPNQRDARAVGANTATRSPLERGQCSVE